MRSEGSHSDKQREPFEVLPPDEERYVEVSGIRARVKIDRIDRLRDGREDIIDYNTVPKGLRDWDSARPHEPQPPLYAVTHDRPVSCLAKFARVKRASVAGVDQTVVIPGTDSIDLAAQVGT